MMQEASSQAEDDYHARGYGAHEVGFGERPAVLVVDFQKANTDPRFPIGGAPLVERAVTNTVRLLAAARRHRVPVAACYTAYNGPEDTPYWKIAAMREIYRHGHPCTELDERILDPAYDVVVCKNGPSMLFQTSVLTFFIRQRVDTVIVTGCNTSGCIRATAVDSFQHGFRTIVPEDCVGDIEQGPHESNLRDIERRYVDVVDADRVIAYFETLPNRNEP
jgi:maleamate amidohydrolase